MIVDNKKGGMKDQTKLFANLEHFGKIGYL
jgi:hypothetical protein